MPSAKSETQVVQEIEAEQAQPTERSNVVGVVGTLDGNVGGRKRKRHLYNSIREQMEFYFGDANLSKDRFLRRFVDQDPYVPLEIFLSFNKIKVLTNDEDQIAKSLTNSTLLQLDETKKKVRRTTPLPQQRNVAEKTLYVEALPLNATHDWLKSVFSRYGPVAYVSLPTYAGSRKIKQFAFIEFERDGSVEKAVNAYAEVQGVLSLEHTNPADLASIRTFQQQQEQSTSELITTSKCEHSDETPQVVTAVKRKSKPKHISESDEINDGVTAKRVKVDATEEIKSDGGTSNFESDQSNTDNDNCAAGQELVAGKEKKRRHKKKKRTSESSKPNIDRSALDIMVLPKTSWSALRNKYLNLQRRKVREIKSKEQNSNMQVQHATQKRTPMHALNPQQLPETKTESSGREEREQLGEDGDVDAPIPPKRSKRNKNTGNAGVHKMKMNFYGAGGGEVDDNKSAASTKAENPAQERPALFKCEPGLIVECKLHEPCVNIKEFKADMRQYADVKYVDIKEGAELAHLRLATSDAAEEMVQKLSSAEMQCKVLHGQAEMQYWAKIENDRELKLTKQVRVQQKRGREKVVKVLAKHTKFDDDFDDNVLVAEPPSATVGNGDS